MLLSFDSQFCFLPLCLVSCSPVRNFNYFCIFLSCYFVFFANLTFVLLFPVSYSIPSVLYLVPLLSARVCGNASLYLYIMLYYLFIHETILMKPWFWWPEIEVSHGFSVSDLRELSRSVLPVWKWLCRCAHRLEISRSNLALVFDVVETLMMVCRYA
jgi:hypothetical protein